MEDCGSIQERNTTLVTIPEHESTERPNDRQFSKMESVSALDEQQQRPDARGGMILARRLRRMKRKMFLEAVGEEYLASMSSNSSNTTAASRAPPLRTLSSTDSTEEEGN